jgi:hypothetical protein
LGFESHTILDFCSKCGYIAGSSNRAIAKKHFSVFLDLSVIQEVTQAQTATELRKHLYTAYIGESKLLGKVSKETSEKLDFQVEIIALLAPLTPLSVLDGYKDLLF